MNDPFGGYAATPPARLGIPSMTVGQLSLRLHMPPATRSFGSGAAEVAQGLAPYCPVDVYRVDEFPAAPATWARTDRARGIMSYFVPALPGHMVWFDLRGCEPGAYGSRTDHHVAAVFSAQGVCAITGRRMEAPPRLTQDPQNYIATTAVQPGRFWRDGFRAADGKTREFVFTEDAGRGVAAQLIGEDRVNAFGVALFLSREPAAPRPSPVVYRGGLEKGVMRGMTKGAAPEVAAGALVNQDVERDGRRLDFWQEHPSAVFIIYYCDRMEFARITAAGNVRGEGWLPGPVGHP